MLWMRHPGRALDAYLDGELAPLRRSRVAAHLLRCPGCRQRLLTTLRVQVALRQVLGGPPA